MMQLSLWLQSLAEIMTTNVVGALLALQRGSLPLFTLRSPVYRW